MFGHGELMKPLILAALLLAAPLSADEIYEKCGPSAWGVIIVNGQKVCLKPSK
jgi:hypothetical protein